MLRAVIPSEALMLISLTLMASGAYAQTKPSPALPPPQSLATVAWEDCAPNGPQLRAAVDRLRATHPDNRDFVKALNAAVGFDADFFMGHPYITVPTPRGLSIRIVFPYASYLLQLSEANAKGHSLSDVAPPAPIVAVMVSASKMYAPDIVNILVDRDGKEMKPVANSLAPTEFANRFGAKTVTHSGTVAFPCSAFALGVPVVVTAIAASGVRIVSTIFDGDRVAYWPSTDARAAEIRAGLASSLIGWPAARVEARLGSPALREGKRWAYSTPAGSLVLHLNESDVVREVNLPNFDLARLRQK
jgi:hypothetical protein